MKLSFPKKSLLMAVMADESTVTGFLLTGLGERGKDGTRNYMIVDKETSDQALEEGFARFLRDDIGVVLIAQSLAERLRNMIVAHQNDEEKLIPTILEIPAKDAPYNPCKDAMLVAAAQKLFGQEAGLEKLKQDDM
jgi:V-type H+-transporting ATPase subunit F